MTRRAVTEPLRLHEGENLQPLVTFVVRVDVTLKPVEQVLFRSEVALLADFVCRPDDLLFRTSGPSNAHCIVFPSSSTRIFRSGNVVIENPTVVAFYNHGEDYRREVISREGTFAAWYTLSDDVLEELLHESGRSVDVRHPFVAPQVNAPSPALLRQRRLFARVRRASMVDALAVEEEVIDITRIVLGVPGSVPMVNVSERLVHRAAERILVDYTSMSLSLARLARELNTSMSHLSRVFHSVTSMTMRDFRQRLRLIASLDRLPDSAGRLTDLALDLGYSSHSHFTSSFRALFDVSPARFIEEVARWSPPRIDTTAGGRLARRASRIGALFDGP